MVKYIAKGVKGLVQGWNGVEQKIYNVLDEIIVYPPDYYESTPDLKTNLKKYEQALKKIDRKYLSDLPKDKSRENFIAAEIELAKINFHLRAGNYSLELLKKGETLEKEYGSFSRAERLRDLYLDLEYQQGKSMESKSIAQWCIANEIVEDIKNNIEPGRFPKNREQITDWEEMVDLLENKLQIEGLDLVGQDYHREIRDIWNSVRREVLEEEQWTSSLEERITRLKEELKGAKEQVASEIESIATTDCQKIDER